MPPQTEKTMPLDEYEKIDQSLSDENQNIVRIKKYLLILLLIQSFVCVVTFGVGFSSVLVKNSANISNGIRLLIPGISLTIYYIFGLAATYKQHRIGLLIFASIGVFLLIAACILFVYVTLVIMAVTLAYGVTSQGYAAIVFFGFFFAFMAFVMIMSLKFSFTLAKLIKANEYSTV
ncbi:unnamed protein product [Rotaria sp. Silwood2]|nr:unnamed protein product [Rotaria sp. Silwood2]CAF3967509.1 unnamed protein product [Rotaria sp. Silwood2]CAF4256865.1 unnamed protein product [Rotaria sp. Silwood2]